MEKTKSIKHMKSIIFGAGTYGEVYASYLTEAGVNIVGFLDDNKSLWGSSIVGIPVLGGQELLPQLLSEGEADSIYCPIGNNKLRVDILSKAAAMGYTTPNFIHPSVLISPNVSIGKGVYILPRSIVMPHSRIEDYVMISIGANIIHHSHLCRGVFLSNGVNLGANIVAKPYAYVGMGATVMTGVSYIGENSLIGAGSAVIRDVPDNAVVAGVPSKILKYK